MDNLTESFGELVFSDRAMSERMSGEAYAALKDAIRTGEPLDINVANAVADAMKAWALEKGAASHRRYRRKARGLPWLRPGWQCHHRVFRQGAHNERA